MRTAAKASLLARLGTRLGAAMAALWLATPAAAQHCREVSFDGTSFAVCEVERGEDLRLFHLGADGAPLGSFARLEAELSESAEQIVFAMNAGMYHADRSPVGLYIEAGEARASLVTRAGPGNFGMLPNGVFCIRADEGFSVVESRAFGANPPECRHASQSGPMLVIDGALHPRFLPNSDSLNLRNGVGVSPDGSRAYFVISNRPVTFHHFGRLFRDELGLRDALYFDGNVSRLYAPELGRNDWGRPMGPIVALVAPR